MNNEAKSLHKRHKCLYIILSAFVIALILRTFFFESYRMPSSQMENAVLRGDYLFVNKIAYGIRMPMAWISFPFVPDSVSSLGIKTYSSFLSLPYTRFLQRKVERNDIVIYNIPLLRKEIPVDKLPLSISRCIGLPGDSIEMKNGSLYINGEKRAQSPDLILPYEYAQKFNLLFCRTMEELNIPFRETKTNTDNVVRYLSRFEAYSLREKLPDSIEIRLQEKEELNYKLFIPRKGASIRLLPQTVHIYQQIIIDEQKSIVKFENGKLYLGNKPVDFYTFNENYYWMLSDNTEASADSRHFGFIPETHIVGKASLIWMSKDASQGFFKGYRPNRIFTKIN